MNIVRSAVISFAIFVGLMLLDTGNARACSPEDGCTECETGMVSICFRAEAARDALEVSLGKYAQKSSLGQNRSSSADTGSDCAECLSYGGDSATRKAFCASYLASGICSR